jgi:Tfp pilus assembly protein PilE
VVVAILGIISAIGVVSYSGYVSGAKRKSAENVMQQISLGQTEYYSDMGIYYLNNSGTSCTPSATTSTQIETNLLGGSDNITEEVGYNICVASDTSNYKIFAKEVSGTCEFTLLANGRFSPPEGKNC